MSEKELYAILDEIRNKGNVPTNNHSQPDNESFDEMFSCFCVSRCGSAV